MSKDLNDSKIRVSCICGKEYLVAMSNAGKSGNCPECGEKIVVPSSPSSIDGSDKSSWPLSLVLLLCVAGIVTLDVLLAVTAISIVSSDLYHEIATILIVLSLPVIPILLTIGTVLGFKEWYSEERPTTVDVTWLNMALLLVIFIIILYLATLDLGGMMSVT